MSSQPELHVHPKPSLLSRFSWLVGLLAGILLGGLAMIFVLAGEIYDYADTVSGAQLPPVDAVVLLAGARGRIQTAAEVWRRYTEEDQPVPVLYISGMGQKSTWTTFSKLLHPSLASSLKPENVILETESTNTDENARWLARYAMDKKWKRILLMTSRYHMRRAHYIFEEVLKANKLDVHVDTYSIYQDWYEPEEWRWSYLGVRVTLNEYLKWIYYRVFWTARPLT